MSRTPGYAAQLVWSAKEMPPFPLHKIITTLGRNEANDILIDDPKVSSFHSNILFRDDGYYLLDMKSRNGTWVNGQRVTECALKDGDQVQIGDVNLKFVNRSLFPQTNVPLARLTHKIQTMAISSPGLRREAEEMIKEVEKQQNILAALMEILSSLAESPDLGRFAQKLKDTVLKLLECKHLELFADGVPEVPCARPMGEAAQWEAYLNSPGQESMPTRKRLVKPLPGEGENHLLIAFWPGEELGNVLLLATGVNPLPREEVQDLLDVVALFAAIIWSNLHTIELVHRKQTEKLLHDKEKHNQERIQQLEQKNRDLGAYLTGSRNRLVFGEGSPMEKVFQLVHKLASVDLPVLITGETGTGKTYIAQSLHHHSQRAAHGFHIIDCATIPSNLIESELFGYEKGAFTGASNRRLGKIETAGGGTVFLDEIGDLPLELQGKLLRFVQEGKFERLGGTETIKVDVRIIAATNYDLDQRVKENKFRQDLFFRLNVLPLHVPPLRERRCDIPYLAKHFIKKHFNEERWSFTDDAEEAVSQHGWPGNVRELENKLQRAWIFHTDSYITSVDLGFPSGVPQAKDLGDVKELEKKTLEEYREEYEGAILARCLKYYTGNITKCAEHLGISRNTCKSMIRKYRINVREFF